ncbi:hypothetical protein HanOQP8_Chr17g0659021 [Helianthus annuus]|nr:hypothetical protein HanLR1_Chr17g0663461 [Helianthus annuus]KAJ0636182.1 hypothetical protein HanOQP8_Chr17g0659021 [Helianthus annuus]
MMIILSKKWVLRNSLINFLSKKWGLMRKLWSISTSERKLHQVRVLTGFETSILWSLYLYFNTVYSGDKHTGPEIVEAMVLIHENNFKELYLMHRR